MISFRNACVRFSVVVALVALGHATPQANAGDDVVAFRVYGWSSFETADPETSSNCSAIDRRKSKPGWAVARREVADVSDLQLPDEQKQGTTFRVIADYCVRVDGDRERPVGAMTFRAAPYEDLDNVQYWGNRHYKATARVSSKKLKPGREHFNMPNFERPR